MRECDCYIEERYPKDYTPLTFAEYRTVSMCYGTKERDRCSCGGDRTKCDFYPEVREKARKELKKTNSDKIRSMNDEELAKCLVNIGWDCHLCSECEKLSDSPLLKDERCDECCVEHCLEWLQKDVKRY